MTLIVAGLLLGVRRDSAGVSHMHDMIVPTTTRTAPKTIGATPTTRKICCPRLVRIGMNSLARSIGRLTAHPHHSSHRFGYLLEVLGLGRS